MEIALNRLKGCGLALLVVLLLISGCGSLPPLSTADAVTGSPQDEASQTVDAEPAEAESQAKAEVAQEAAESENTAASNGNTNDTATESAVVDNSTEAEVEAEAATEVAAVDTGAAIPPLGRVSEDFSLVGNTGRPQLVYTFADW